MYTHLFEMQNKYVIRFSGCIWWEDFVGVILN
jgi:hypothetical protein